MSTCHRRLVRLVAAGCAGWSAVLLAGCTALPGAPAGEPSTRAAAGERQNGSAGDPPFAGASGTKITAGTPGWIRAENARPGTPGWRIPPARGAAPGLSAYADHASILPGTALGLRIDGRGTVSVTAYRTGWYGGTGARAVWSGTTTVTPQPSPRGSVDDGPVVGLRGVARTHLRRAPWRTTTTVPTNGWLPGHYLVRVDLGPASRFVPVTVRDEDWAGKLVLVTATMTWQAYNRWGGASLYQGPGGGFSTRSLAVSYDRPYLEGYGAGHYLYREYPLVQLAERAGLDTAYVTDLDLALRPRQAATATGIVFGAHSEYWTALMRAGLQQAVDHGVNLAVFGANTGYWRVRLGGAADPANPRVVFGAKDAALDPLAATDPAGATAKFKAAPRPVAEDALFGQVYDCFPVKGDLVVSDPSWWGFAGSGVAAGTHLVGVAGPETDRVYLRPGRPVPAQVVTYGPASCYGTTTPVTSVYLSRSSGAGVFAAGTMGWVPALSSAADPTRSILATVTTTILTAFAQAKAGAAHPATDTAGRYSLPPRRTTPYAG